MKYSRLLLFLFFLPLRVDSHALLRGGSRNDEENFSDVTDSFVARLRSLLHRPCDGPNCHDEAVLAQPVSYMNSRPAVFIRQPQNGASVTLPFGFEAVAYDAEDGEIFNPYSFHWYDEYGNFLSYGKWGTIGIGILPPGPHTIWAVAFDSQNLASFADSVNIQVVGPGQVVGPVVTNHVTIVQPPANAIFTTKQSFRAVAMSAIPGTVIWVIQDEIPIVRFGGDITIDAGVLGVGFHTLTATWTAGMNSPIVDAVSIQIQIVEGGEPGNVDYPVGPGNVAIVSPLKVTIVNPPNGKQIQIQQKFRAEVIAVDVDEGEIADKDVTWYADGKQVVGKGKKTRINAQFHLGLGFHEIWVEAKNSKGSTGISDRIGITVKPSDKTNVFGGGT